MFWPLLGTGLPFRFRLTLLPGCWLLAYLAVAPPIPSQADEPALKQSWGELSADKDRLAREFAQFVNAGKLDEAVATAEKWLAVARRLLSVKPGGADGEKALEQARRETGTLLEWLALQHSRHGNWPAALRRQQELAELWEQVHGKADYRAADAPGGRVSPAPAGTRPRRRPAVGQGRPTRHPGVGDRNYAQGDFLRRAAAPSVIAHHARAACGGGHRPVAAAAVGHARGRSLLPRQLPGTGRTRRPLR